MSALPNKNINPVLAALANFCCCAILGYILVGQTRKGIFPLISVLIVAAIGVVIATVLGYIFWPLGSIVYLLVGCINTVVSVFAVIDVYKVAEAVQQGQEVDENEYKFELLYKVMSNIDKQAIYKG
jgi:hypothetical protein